MNLPVDTARWSAFAKSFCVWYEVRPMLIMLKKSRRLRDRKRCVRKNAKHQAKNRGRRLRIAGLQ